MGINPESERVVQHLKSPERLLCRSHHHWLYSRELHSVIVIFASQVRTLPTDWSDVLRLCCVCSQYRIVELGEFGVPLIMGFALV